ncbi:MAG: putative porin [Chromatiales bacterium]|jgi:hypothetical protein|nr:putative porin [Chromatiales bacterium]
MRRLLSVLALGALMNAPGAYAAVSDEVVQQLLDRLEAQEKRIAELEKTTEKTQTEVAEQKQAVAKVAAAPAPAAPAASAWADKISLKGDLRMRYENIDDETKTDERNRQRIRARLGVIAKPQDNLELGLGLSTTEKNDPRSSNQTLGNGGSSKDFVLDLAYFKWAAMQGLSVSGGKFQSVLYRPGQQGLLWDSDWNPEGFGLNYVNGVFFANATGFWLESDSTKEEEFTWGGQLGASLPLADDVKLTAGAGYYRFNTEGKGPFYSEANAATDFGGNSFDPVGETYLYDYEEIEAFAELGLKVAGLPLSIYADFVKNSDADDYDTGWVAGTQLGAAKAKGTWQIGYAYQDLEADAVFAGLTDSDFAGGKTDSKGHRLQGAYALGDKWNLAVTYFINEAGVDTGAGLDYDRLQLDMNFKY